MPEYSHIEKPFLTQLCNLGWNVIEQGAGIPTDTTRSKRTSFREVMLKDEFMHAVQAINTTDDGKIWLTRHPLEEQYDDLIKLTRNNLL